MSGAWLVLFIGMWVVCIALVTLVLGLSRRIGALEVGLAGRTVDTAAHEIRPQLLGRQFADLAVESGVVGASDGMAGVLLFVSEGCGPCQMLAASLAARLDEEDATAVAQVVGIRVTVITDQAGAFDELGATAVIVDPDGKIRREFGVAMTPTGIALNDDGVVVEAMIANQYDHVEKLARAAQPDSAKLNVVLSA
jgi:hypothetical protein